MYVTERAVSRPVAGAGGDMLNLDSSLQRFSPCISETQQVFLLEGDTFNTLIISNESRNFRRD